MYPDSQNQNSYPNQVQPQQTVYPGPQPAQPIPQGYGPQQYVLPPSNGQNMPGQQPAKNNTKLFVFVIVLAVLLVLVICLAVFMNLSKTNKKADHEMTKVYSSPLGMVPGMQVKDIKSGVYKLRASYVTGGEFIREGSFSVKDGHVYLDMVPDANRVNELMKFLYDRQNTKIVFDATKHGVSQSISYDFAAMLGYYYLYDRNGGDLSGFVPEIEAAKAGMLNDKRYTLTSSCDTALADVKKQTDMNTTGIVFETSNLGINKKEAKVSFSTLRAIDKSVMAFFDNCYDLNQPNSQKLKEFVDKRRADVTKSPTFTYWQEGGVNYLDVSAPPKDTPFGGEMHFELKELKTSPGDKEVSTGGSFVERRNQFGLAYSLCRVDPVITKAATDGYRFLREDPEYKYPNILDTGYYCSTLDVPPQFTEASTINLNTTTGRSVSIVGEPITGLRGIHDLVYEVEKYNLGNKRYPGPIEFRDMASGNMDSLTDATQAAFNAKTLIYTPLPAECVGTCNDYSLSFVPATNVQVQRTTYKP